VTQVLRVEGLADACRADEVREEHGDDPTLLRHHRTPVVRSGRLGELDKVDMLHMLPWYPHSQEEGKWGSICARSFRTAVFGWQS